MSASSNRILSNINGRTLLLALVVLLVVSASGCLLGGRPNKDRLVRELNSQLREERFVQLYEEAESGLSRNVTKGKFVQRMRTAVAKLKAIDPDLNFTRDWESEEAITKMRDESFVITAYQKLEKDGKSVQVGYYWDEEGQFANLYVIPDAGTSDEYNVYGVGYKHLYLGGKLID